MNGKMVDELRYIDDSILSTLSTTLHNLSLLLCLWNFCIYLIITRMSSFRNSVLDGLRSLKFWKQ